MAKKKNKNARITRRTVRLVTHFGRVADLVSKLDGTVLAEGAEAWAMHCNLFKKRISGKNTE